MKSRDVVIIGGGLAGGAAAALLAKRGIDVLLLEKESQPHHKVCGEFISYEAQHYLKKLDVDLMALGAQSINHLRLAWRDKSVVVPLGFEALSLSRRCLDEAVLLQAQIKGVEVKYGVSVTGLSKDLSNWVITCPDKNPIIAKNVFLATGKHDLRGWSQRAGQQNNYIGFKMYFQLTTEQQAQLAGFVEIILFKGGYAGLELVEGGKTNLCLVVSKERFAVCGKNWESLFNALLQTTPALALRLASAQPCWEKPLAIYGIPYGFVYGSLRNDPSALFRLGDQMAVIPSLCGDGMAIALHTGFLATDCYLNTGAFDYHRNASQQLKSQINHATFISCLISSPLLQPWAVTFSRIFPEVITSAIRHTRIATILS